MAREIILDSDTSHEVNNKINSNYAQLYGETDLMDSIILSGITEDGWVYHIWRSGYTELWTTISALDVTFSSSPTGWSRPWTRDDTQFNYIWYNTGYLLHHHKKYPVIFNQPPMELATVHTAFASDNAVLDTIFYTENTNGVSDGMNTDHHSGTYRAVMQYKSLAAHSITDPLNAYIDLYVTGQIDLVKNGIDINSQYHKAEEMPSALFIKYHNENFSNLFNNQTNKCFVSEYGETSDGIWKYRKWSNNFIEMWGTKVANVQFKSGQQYSPTYGKAPAFYSSHIYGGLYPSRSVIGGSFVKRPVEIAFAKKTNPPEAGLINSTWTINGLNTTTSAGNYALMTGASLKNEFVNQTTLHSATLNLYVAGFIN